jgi:hypothetical protein
MSEYFSSDFYVNTDITAIRVIAAFFGLCKTISFIFLAMEQKKERKRERNNWR